MSKILVVETHRMLQQAIALALFPEHEVKIGSTIPESSELKGFDAVIVDVGSIGESEGDIEQAIRVVQSWKVPTVWVQGSSNRQTPRREKLVSLNPPIEKEVLLSALAECLGIPSGRKRFQKAAGSSKARANRSGAAATAGDSEVIELLEIVEESSEGVIQQAQQKI